MPKMTKEQVEEYLYEVDESGWDRLAWAQTRLNEGFATPTLELAATLGDRFPYPEMVERAREIRRLGS